MAVSSTVVNDGNFFQLELFSGVKSQASAQCVVIGDDAVSGLVTRLSQVRVGGGTSDVRDTAVVVDLGSGDGGA